MHASTMRVKMCLRVLRASRAEDWILVWERRRVRRKEGRALLREGTCYLYNQHIRSQSLQFTDYTCREGEGPGPTTCEPERVRKQK